MAGFDGARDFFKHARNNETRKRRKDEQPNQSRAPAKIGKALV